MKLKLSFIPGIAWFLLCTWLLTLPGEKIPTENFFTRYQVDKWVHIAMFFIMVVLWCWGLKRRDNFTNLKKAFVITAFVWFAWGIGMEFVQRYCTANRSFDAGDIVADGVGCLIGFLYSSKRYKKKRPL